MTTCLQICKIAVVLRVSRGAKMISFPSSCRDMALFLISQGISCIPLHPFDEKQFNKEKRVWEGVGKTPYGKLLPIVNGTSSWIPFQERLPTQAEVTEWFTRIPAINLAIVTGRLSGLFVIDVDGPEGLKWFREHIASVQRPFLIQYTRSTERFHAFYQYPPEGVEVKTSSRVVHDEIDIRGKGGYVVISPSRHPETKKQYHLQILEGFTDIRSQAVLPPEVIQLINTPKKKSGQRQRSESVENFTFLNTIEEGQRNSSLTSLVGRWLGKGLSKEETCLMARSVNAHFVNPPLSDDEVMAIVASISRRDAQEGHSRAERLRAWIMMQEKSTFTTADIFSQLGIQFAAEKFEVVKELDTFLRQGVIERVGSRASTYRRVCREVQRMDLDADDTGKELPLCFPFGLHHKVSFREKNIILIAGETNSSKTTLCFSICYMNSAMVQKGLLPKFRYITSEMTPGEIKDKISRFNSSPAEWVNFCDFYTRSSDYADIIDPSAINIIDYLERYDNFYLMGEDIKRVFDKLTTGIAIICIQKRKDADFGRGGEYTLEKARLGLSLYRHGNTNGSLIGSMKVTKAKCYRPGRNPEGEEYFFELRDGYFYDRKCLGLVNPHKNYLSSAERKRIIAEIEKHCSSDIAQGKSYGAYGEEL